MGQCPARPGDSDRAGRSARMLRGARRARASDARWRLGVVTAFVVSVCCLGCTKPGTYLEQADRAAYQNVTEAQQKALERTEPFTIESSEVALRRRLLLDQQLPVVGPASLGSEYLQPTPHWPLPKEPADPDFGVGGTPSGAALATLRLSLLDALRVGARNNREYQSRKEDVFRAALRLDLERDEFRNSYAGLLTSLFATDRSGDPAVTGVESSAEAGVTRRLKSGATLTLRLALDLVKLFTQGGDSSLGLLADASVSIPLLRGAGRHIVTEPLTQAERDVVYAVYEFEHFKKTFVVQVASDYLAVLRQLDEVENAEENYRRLVTSARRARRLADAGRLPEIQVDQARQDELRARNRWIIAQDAYERARDDFKNLLSLPPDAAIELDPAELDRLARAAERGLAAIEAESPARSAKSPPADAPVELAPRDRRGAGPLELDARLAIDLALANRLDLRVSEGRVDDAQRLVVVAADALQADLTLEGGAIAGERRTVGSAGLSNARLDPDEGSYTARLLLDLPWERTAERNAFRESLIGLEQRVRELGSLEDDIKLEIRDGLRNLAASRETFRIQAQAVRLARRRVESTNLLLQAGRAEIRDLLEAQEALVSAQNAQTAALVNYRVAELELQRDMGMLQVNETGLWQEYRPEKSGVNRE